MKKNYTKSLLAGLVICLTQFVAQAQTVVEETITVDSSGDITGTDLVILGKTTNVLSSVITLDGDATFQLQFTLTADGPATRTVTVTDPVTMVETMTTEPNTQSMTAAPSGTGWAVFSDSDLNDAHGTSIDGDDQETITVSDIAVVNFESGTTGLTSASISDLSFSGALILNGNNNRDGQSIGVNGGALVDVGKVVDLASFGTEFQGLNTTGITVNQFTVKNTSTAFNHRFSLGGVVVQYTVTTGTVLSVDAVSKLRDEFTVSPNPVSDAFSVGVVFDSLELIDITGNIAKTFASSDVLTVSGISSGVYIVKAVVGNTVIIDKLVVK